MCGRKQKHTPKRIANDSISIEIRYCTEAYHSRSENSGSVRFVFAKEGKCLKEISKWS